MQFTHLKHLDLFDRTKDQKSLSFKIDEIEKVLVKARKKNKGTQGGGRRYEASVVSREEIPTAVEWQGSVDEWIIYKYPKGYKSPVPSRQPGCPRYPDALNELGILTSEPESSFQGTAPPRHMSKRSRTEFEADSTLKSSRKARRMTRETPGKFVTYNVEQYQTPRPETPPQVSAGQSFAKLRAYMEVFRTPSPALGPLQESPGSPSPAEASFQDPFRKYQFLFDFIEDSPGSQEITPAASCPAVVDPRSIFRNPCEAFIGLDITEDNGNNLKANYVDDYIPVLSCAPNDVVSSTENVDLASDEVFVESLIERDNRDDLAELDNDFSINYFDSEKDTDDEFVDIDSLVLDAPTQLAPEPECPEPEAPAPEEEFIPKQFIAERKTTEGLQFLVQ